MDFANQIAAFERETKKKLTRVYRESTRDIVKSAQTTIKFGGNMPEHTGYLHKSLVVQKNTQKPQQQKARGVGLSDDQKRAAAPAHPGWENEIMTANLNHYIAITWTAFYSHIQEFGGVSNPDLTPESYDKRKFPARYYATRATEQWDTFVHGKAQSLA